MNKKIIILLMFLMVTSQCTIKHQIEPSDKPFQVNLNVKIDHEVRIKIAEQNKDLLNLEDEYLKKKKSKTN